MGLWSKLFGPDPGYAGDTKLQTSSDPRRPVNYSDWQESDSCLTLLRQCTCPRAIEELAKDSRLANAFPESMDQVVEGLKIVGALVECDDPAARIAYNRGAVALRQLCIDNGFKKIGTKDDMARRLVGIDPMGTRLGYAGRLFVCSEMAAAVIEAERKAYRASQLDDPLLRDLFTRTDFDVEKQRLTSSWKQPPSDDDVKLSLLNRRIVEHAKMGEWAICSSLYYTMSLFESRRGHYEHALKLAFIVCADDLCGVSNGGGFNPTLAMLPPDLIKHIRDVADEHAVSGEQLHTFFVERVDALQMPIATEKLWKVVDLALTGSIELKDQPACDTKIRLLLHD